MFISLIDISCSNALLRRTWDHCRYLAALANATGLGASFAQRVAFVYPLEARNGSVRMTLLDIMGDSNIGCTSFDSAMLASRALSSFFYR